MPGVPVSAHEPPLAGRAGSFAPASAGRAGRAGCPAAGMAEKRRRAALPDAEHAGTRQAVPLADAAFEEGRRLAEQWLQGGGYTLLEQQRVERPGGQEWYARLAGDPLEVKACVAALEEQEPLGRLLDLDVLQPDGSKVGREQLGLPPGPACCAPGLRQNVPAAGPMASKRPGKRPFPSWKSTSGIKWPAVWQHRPSGPCSTRWPVRPSQAWWMGPTAAPTGIWIGSRFWIAPPPWAVILSRRPLWAAAGRAGQKSCCPICGPWACRPSGRWQRPPAESIPTKGPFFPWASCAPLWACFLPRESPFPWRDGWTKPGASPGGPWEILTCHWMKPPGGSSGDSRASLGCEAKRQPDSHR